MSFTVVRLPSVTRVVERELSQRERRAYDAAVEALKGEGCRAGGKRLAGTDMGDYPLCQRALYGSWRMVTAYLPDGRILIVEVSRHTAIDSPSARLAETVPGLSPVGRHRADQPPCCDDAASPPSVDPDLEKLLFEVSGLAPPRATASRGRRRRAPSSGRRHTRRPSGTAA